MKTWSVVFGIGLGLLWLFGISTNTVNPAPLWMSWLDGVGAILAFVVAGAIGRNSMRNRNVSASVTLSVGLFALWIVGLATNGVAWQNWWTFVFACGFMIIGLVARQESSSVVTPIKRETVRNHFKKSA